MSAKVIGGRRSMRRPRVGQVVLCKFGEATIIEVRHQGLQLLVAVPVRGREVLERATTGWWSIVEPTP